MRKILDSRVDRQSYSIRKVNSAPESGTIRTALEISREYPVFPCDSQSKRPLTQHGFKDASQDPQVVTRWWRAHPEALIGVPTGRASGLIAVDCDPGSGQWYQTHRGRLGAHRIHQTRRGKHLLYRLNGHGEVRNSESEVAKGVDVRGEGGYVIWWPAHGGVSVGEPGDMPDWLYKAARTRKVVDGPVGVPPADSRDVRKYCDGERNGALSARAHYYRKMGMSTRELGAALLKYDLEHCEPPYQTTDGKHKVLYIANKKAHLTSDEEDQAHARANTHLTTRALADVSEEQVDWLWKGFLARNKVHIIAGAGATMKSTLTLSMAATVTRGGDWPDGSQCPQGKVILWTGEDDLGDTVKPRFRFAGGDQSQCVALTGVTQEGVKRAFDPATDIKLLDEECARLGDVALIIIDPVVVIVQKDNNNVSDVRRALYPLQQLAEKHHVVILGIQHFNKGSKGKDPVERITGSGGWSQAPRIVLGTAPIIDGDGKDPTRYVFACLKTFAKKQRGGYEYGYEEEPKTEIARIVWGRYLDGTGQAILTEAEGGDDGASKLGAAKQLLRNLLAKGSMSNWDIAKRAEDAKISGITLKRAREALNIKPIRVGKHDFRWQLPDNNDNET